VSSLFLLIKKDETKEGTEEREEQSFNSPALSDSLEGSSEIKNAREMSSFVIDEGLFSFSPFLACYSPPLPVSFVLFSFLFLILYTLRC
jgi:hypothetical protein